ncbi:exodeoxyribonuclease VII large subunit [Leptolyngbya sp. FACHB-261]|uniref:exodeoxyribonuclease VII large subunit n=1 Tax=Leptolyngbya sp. FACHB-261 TaxID=2692806 RepID=UPI00168A30CA|nr:exodeoxyribonuclease VII large subunit [Leptolyngbya sp. FACHB-261]MBD2102930.1 exodeoxyribonuclease VII large subunit [Leptolyngbya sp. FACHB-261]
MDFDADLLIPLASARDGMISVGGLSSYIQALLEEDALLSQLWIIGEVSSAAPHRNGHVFFTLQDPDTGAAINGVVWARQVSKLAVLPTRGQRVIVLGRVQTYPQKGQYQLTAFQVLPGGEGLQALQAKQLRERLAAEGLFDVERKRPLPAHPQIIAVVSSPQAAAWGDIQRTLKARYPGLKVLFSPAIVQGEQAPASIAQAIARVGQDGRAEVLLLARGGGAAEDLFCFNDERVVRAIAESPIPVLTGIGHQRDETLADLVADAYAHTPTAAAEQIVPALSDLEAAHRLRKAALQTLLQRRLEQEQVRLSRLRQPLQRALIWRYQRAEQQQQTLRARLVALDPQAVLQRGYAVVRQASGTICKQANAVQPGELLTLQLAEGNLQVKVIDPSES